MLQCPSVIMSKLIAITKNKKTSKGRYCSWKQNNKSLDDGEVKEGIFAGHPSLAISPLLPCFPHPCLTHPFFPLSPLAHVPLTLLAFTPLALALLALASLPLKIGPGGPWGLEVCRNVQTTLGINHLFKAKLSATCLQLFKQKITKLFFLPTSQKSISLLIFL